MAQQTAVQWLVMTYNQRQGYIRFEDIDKAKEMEREQIIDAHINGQSNYHFSLESRTEEAEQYYNDNYENNK